MAHHKNLKELEKKMSLKSHVRSKKLAEELTHQYAETAEEDLKEIVPWQEAALEVWRRDKN